jgi:hypothetical protein
MPQLSSTDRLLMASHDMTDALKNSHPDDPFSTVVDDIITALTVQQASITRAYRIPT